MRPHRQGLRGRRRKIALLLLVIELLGIAWLVLNPNPSAPGRAVEVISRLMADLGLPEWASDPVLWEFLLNIALFVPLTFLAWLLWPRLGVLGWTLLAAVLSAYLELTQLLLLPTRTPTLSDLVANTSGGLVGALAALAAAALVPTAVWGRQEVGGDRRPGRPQEPQVRARS